MKLRLHMVILVAFSFVASAAVSTGCSIGGEVSFSPDPTIGGLIDDGDDPVDGTDGGGGGGGGDGDYTVEGQTAEEEEKERDCFLDGFCYRQCSEPADCPAGFSCIMSVCTFDCQSDEECGSGGVCNDAGLCETTSTSIAGCTNDAECGADRFCNASAECEQVAVQLGCQGDADCPLGDYCDEAHSCTPFPGPDVGCAADGDCPGDYYCSIGAICEQDCRSSVQCNTGEACDATGRCVTVGTPARFVAYSFGSLSADADPASGGVFSSTSYSVSNVEIVQAGRNQVLSSSRYRLVGSTGF